MLAPASWMAMAFHWTSSQMSISARALPIPSTGIPTSATCLTAKLYSILCWRALLWRETAADFNTRPDRWLSHLAQGAEWFPLLGLIGTVVAILQTFSAITPGSRPEPSEIIRKYAPAITATGGGLYMAFINILPSWVANVGRDLIRALGGYAPPPESSATPGGTP